MTKKISPRSLLNKNKNYNKSISIENLKLDDISIKDLKLSSDESNFDRYINLRSLLNSVSSCQISDAYNGLTRRSGVISNLKSINNLKAYGSIVTCKTSSNDWGTSVLAIDKCNEGDILFLVANDNSAAIWGELASTCAKNKKIRGTAVYGSSRDLDALYHMDFPVFSVDSVSNAGTPLGLGKINVDVTLEDITISPGDFFFGDETGVVVIPKKLFNEVMNETLDIKIKESKIISLIDKGNSLSDIVGL